MHHPIDPALHETETGTEQPAIHGYQIEEMRIDAKTLIHMCLQQAAEPRDHELVLRWDTVGGRAVPPTAAVTILILAGQDPLYDDSPQDEMDVKCLLQGGALDLHTATDLLVLR